MTLERAIEYALATGDIENAVTQGALEIREMRGVAIGTRFDASLSFRSR
jgi:hypothetical protein